jgi:hypothetical protein
MIKKIIHKNQTGCLVIDFVFEFWQGVKKSNTKLIRRVDNE